MSEPSSIFIPVRTVSEANRRDHYHVKARRVRQQRDIVAKCLIGHPRPTLPAVVTLTRIGWGRLDRHDNLPAALKACVDEIALWLGVDDGSDAVQWHYQQGTGPAAGVRVDVKGRG